MRPVYTERDIPRVANCESPLTILTPSARDLAKKRGVKIVQLKKGESGHSCVAAETVAIGSDHGGIEDQKLLLMFAELEPHDSGIACS